MGIKTVLAALSTALAAGLFWYGASAHLERACVLKDTDYLPLCLEAKPDSDPGRQQELRGRLRDNPGDSTTWVELASLNSDEPPDALLGAIAALAPTDPNSLRLRARQSVLKNDLPAATELLVEMTDHDIGGDEPPQLLARLLASHEGDALLRPHLVAGSHWLPKVLASLTSLKLPLESGLALVADAAKKEIVTPESVQSYVRSLKAAGKWADAYGLWVAQQRQPVPILFNGGFENRFQPDGFDWEIAPVAPSRAGALVDQRMVAGHGRVLEIQYTGWALPAPVVRQMLFVAAGRYTLEGQYMSSKLRMEEGLAWAVRCADGAQTLAGKSGPLKDTAGVWQSFRFEFKIPAGCGAVASLQLETFAPFEAATGFRGSASFDNFELHSLGS